MRQIRSFLSPIAAALLLFLISIPAWAVSFNQINLVTDDQAANLAQITDPDLKNAWGMAAPQGRSFWISANGSGKVLSYNVDPLTQATTKGDLTILIPGDGSVTGQVSKEDNRSFIFLSEDGTISAWNYTREPLGCCPSDYSSPNTGTRPASAIAALMTASYKGTAIGSISGSDYLYAADFKTGTIDAFKVDAFKGNATAPSLSGSFIDPTLPSGYGPFNVQNLNGALYVAYALSDNATLDEVKGAGLGYVDKFSLNGDFIERVVSGGTLNAPWGLAIAPSSFGAMAGDLLVGNFGDGHINIYDPTTHAYLGQVLDANNQPITIDGLWAILPGNDAYKSGGSSHLLYFTAGPGNETHGLFGVLAPVPEPSEYAMMIAGLGLLILATRRRDIPLIAD